VICGQGVAPAGLSAALVKDQLGLDLIPGTGLLPAMVPGAFDAWVLMLRDHGTWSLRDVMSFAIGYARRGIHYVPRIVATLNGVRPLFEAEWPTSAALWLRGGGPQPGGLYANPTLADTWERLLREAESAGHDRIAQIEAARGAWYGGFVAEAIDRFFRANEVLDSSGRRHRGVLTGDDMARWRATVEAPLRCDYRGTTVLKCGAWSQGPTMLQTLALLEGFDVAGMDPLGERFIHTVVECLKLAFADREAWYGDVPDVPVEHLLSREYADQRRRLIGEEASLELRPGTIPGREAPRVDHDAASRIELLTRDPGAGEPTVARLGAVGGDTCHVDVIDRWGNMVSATPSGGWLQSSPAIPELGFCLGTRGQMFWLDESLPNGLMPGKRPRTTLSPGMALKDGRPWLAFGTPGGEQQDQWQPIMFSRIVDHALNIQQAIDAPSFHTEHWPSSFWPRVARPGKLVIEGRYPPEVAEALQARGHLVEVGGEWSEGRLSAARQEVDGQLYAGANPRGMQGYAVGR
jgi:gamma-glutamyltranspeptidase/glutathione hydrolase